MSSVNFVLDSSFTLAWVFADEATPVTNAVRRSLGTGAKAVVPPLWRWEVGNALLMGIRRKRISQDGVKQHLTLLAALPIDVDENAFGQLWGETLALAQKYQLTLYDATYLESAKRLGLPLASFDGELRGAAKAEKVELLPDRLG